MDRTAMVRTLFAEGWNRQNFQPLEKILHAEFAFHVGGRSRTMNLDGLREIVGRWHTAFRNLEFKLHAIVASGRFAAVHATLTGTHRGTWSGIEATGRSIEVEHMFFFRFDRGLVVEVWELLDRPALERQLTDEA